MPTILEQQAEDFLATKLGRTPTAEEIRLAIESPYTLSNIHNSLEVGSSILTVQPGESLQDAIDKLAINGQGILNLAPDVYTVDTYDIVVPSDIVIRGNGATIDFNGSAHQILMEGTLVYNTGTISINFGDTTLTGTGTTWDVSMEGHSVLIGDFWYVVETVNSTTDITIDAPFMGEDLSGDTYVIADILTSLGLEDLNVQNSTVSAIKGRYIDGCNMDNVNVYSSDIGFDFEDCSNVTLPAFSTYDCTTWSVLFNNVPYAVFDNFGILQGAGISLTRVSNTAMGAGSFQATTTVALSFTDCFNFGVINYAIIGSASHGIEMVSDNYDIDLISGYYAQITGDCIKLTDTADGLTMNNNSFKTYGGYGINIGNANCDKNIITANSFDGGGSGAVNDSGTGTLIRSNIGVADN
jgi:hypothetical protein